jgi:hypothetical protein
MCRPSWSSAKADIRAGVLFREMLRLGSEALRTGEMENNV